MIINKRDFNLISESSFIIAINKKILIYNYENVRGWNEIFNYIFSVTYI